jgi:hypothetical protein
MAQLGFEGVGFRSVRWYWVEGHQGGYENEDRVVAAVALCGTILQASRKVTDYSIRHPPEAQLNSVSQLRGAPQKDDSSPVRAACARVLAEDPDPVTTKVLATKAGLSAQQLWKHSPSAVILLPLIR